MGSRFVVTVYWFSAFLLSALLPVGHCQWTQWRGTHRDGTVAARAIEQLPEPVMLWQREVGGGYSGPIINGEHIWVHTRMDNREVVCCLKRSDGEAVWSNSYPVPFQQDPDAGPHGEGPYSTPALADGRLFTLSITSVLSAWNAVDGSLIWRRDYAGEFNPAYPYFGASASPLVWKEICLVHFGSSGRGPADCGAMIALRVSDGKEMWRWGEDAPAIGASPVIGVIDGNEQLVFKSLENIVGLNPRTGKELWRIPFKVAMDNTIVTPLLLGNRLLTSDYETGFHAWQIQSQKASWSFKKLWRNKTVSLFMSSPVLVGGLLVGFSHYKKGQLFCLDPENGKILWRGTPRWGEHASLVAWGNQLLVFREDGSLVVGTVTRKGLQAQRRYRLGSSKMWGHPAVIKDRIIIKDRKRLVVYRISA